MIAMDKILQKAKRDGKHKIDYNGWEGVELNDKQKKLFETALEKRALADYAAAELSNKRAKEAQLKKVQKDTADAIESILGGYAVEKSNMRKKFAVQGFFDITNLAGDEFREKYIKVGNTELLASELLRAAKVKTEDSRTVIEIDITQVQDALQKVLDNRENDITKLQNYFDEEIKKWKEIDMEYVRDMMLGDK